MTASGEQPSRGRVLQWHADEGWGAIVSPEFDGPVWVHFSSIDPGDRNTSTGGYRSLREGEAVEFTAERADQDGYRWRAIRVRSSEGNLNSEETQP
ncbi:cold-shock protein [Lentzea aerocolonigenes]|uniref:cold-shock protein n=1 Tax=Lentzea aerocolonigenes TaxID=68170 RepID=UPI0009DF3E23|nr:cold shock domain-containing protein [Lentzea aerocolonigenes]